MSDVANISIALLFLDQVVLASHIDWEVFEDLWREACSINSFKLESLDELVL